VSENDELVPVFSPPLAELYARSEQLKGAPITEAEAVRIRDGANCIMMAGEKARRMEIARGYRDVTPEDCWPDWHRLRSEMTGKGFLPRIVLCLLGNGRFAQECTPLLDFEKVEYEFTVQDPHMVRSFVHSASPLDTCLEDADMQQIPQHAMVLYVLSKNFTAAQGPAECQRFLSLGTRLLAKGGIAMKCDSSGIAHGRVHWVKLANDVAAGVDTASTAYWYALLRAFVQWPIQSQSDLFTCGMHLLGQPDLIVSEQVLLPYLSDANLLGAAAVDLFGSFAMYLLSECPAGKFTSGSTFRADQDSPRLRVLWEGCSGYDDDEYFFNPFGRWRFTLA
jgi:hypothetical protein